MSLLYKQCVFTPTCKNTLFRDTLRPVVDALLLFVMNDLQKDFCI